PITSLPDPVVWRRPEWVRRLQACRRRVCDGRRLLLRQLLKDRSQRSDRNVRRVALAHHYGASSFTGVRMGAPLPFSSTTTNLAGSVVLALRPTTCTSSG